MYNAIICFLVEWCKLFANIAHKHLCVPFVWVSCNSIDSIAWQMQILSSHSFSIYTATATSFGILVPLSFTRLYVCRIAIVVEYRIQIKIEFVWHAFFFSCSYTLYCMFNAIPWAHCTVWCFWTILSLTKLIGNNKSDSTMIFCRRASITNLMALKTIRAEFNKGRHFGIDAFAYAFQSIWLCLSVRPFCLVGSVSYNRNETGAERIQTFIPSARSMYVYIIFPLYFGQRQTDRPHHDFHKFIFNTILHRPKRL